MLTTERLEFSPALEARRDEWDALLAKAPGRPSIPSSILSIPPASIFKVMSRSFFCSCALMQPGN